MHLDNSSSFKDFPSLSAGVAHMYALKLKRKLDSTGARMMFASSPKEKGPIHFFRSLLYRIRHTRRRRLGCPNWRGHSLGVKDTLKSEINSWFRVWMFVIGCYDVFNIEKEMMKDLGTPHHFLLVVAAQVLVQILLQIGWNILGFVNLFWFEDMISQICKPMLVLLIVRHILMDWNRGCALESHCNIMGMLDVNVLGWETFP